MKGFKILMSLLHKQKKMQKCHAELVSASIESRHCETLNQVQGDKSRFVQQALILFLLVIIFAGCSSLTDIRSFIHPDADFSFYQKVGVLPFKTQAEDRLAGEKVTEHFMTELLIRGELEVMDPGQFNAVVAQVAGTAAPASMVDLTPAQIAQIADVADIQGIFTGTVHDYKMIQLGSEQYPMISMTVKFIDALTGKVVWQNSVTATGGPNLPIVSIGEEFTLGQLSQKVSKKVVGDFYKKAYSK